MSNANQPLTVVIPPVPSGLSVAEWWPVSTEVEWRQEAFVDNKPTPSSLRGADVLVATDFTKEMAAECDSLKAILIAAAGYDRIDPEAVPEGVVVANAYHHEAPIAEWVMAVAVALDHHLIEADRNFREGKWNFWPQRFGSYRELMSRTFGIIGYGAIGRRVAKLANAYDMRVIVAGRTEAYKQEAENDGVEYFFGPDGMKKVLSESDFLLVSTPLIDATRGLIGTDELVLMKPTSYLINPARGHIVDEKALFDALQTRSIAGAAIDTWYEYPVGDSDQPRPSRYPFWELENVIMTPHQSGATFGTRDRRAQTVAENIDRLAAGKPLMNVITELSRD